MLVFRIYSWAHIKVVLAPSGTSKWEKCFISVYETQINAVEKLEANEQQSKHSIMN